jgi:phage terminase large subunit
LHLRATGNPGNVGSKWVKELFIEPAMPNTRFVEKVEYTVNGKTHSTEITRRFIPASVWDNPYLTQDEGYVAMLASLPEVKRQQFLYGNWDAVDDGAFPDFSREDHVVEPFDIPSGWTKLRGADYGYSSPVL